MDIETYVSSILESIQSIQRRIAQGRDVTGVLELLRRIDGELWARVEYLDLPDLSLEDDGTLDTVIRCLDCGTVDRYSSEGIERAEDGSILDDEWERLREEHECANPPTP